MNKAELCHALEDQTRLSFRATSPANQLEAIGLGATPFFRTDSIFATISSA